MIKNWILLVAAAAIPVGSGCQPQPKDQREQYQGVVELDERVLAFEAGGRVTKIGVEQGDLVKREQEVARIDDSMEKTAREARQAEVEVAKAQVDLLEAGARPEEIRSLEARIRAVKTTEALLSKNLARERLLLGRGVTSRAAVDELETKLNATIADRQSLEQQLKGLRRGARKQEIAGAKSRVEAADKSLTLQTERIDRLILRAPAEGAVLDVHVDKGEVVGPGAPVITLGDTKHPYCEVFVPIGALDGIKVGTRASLEVDSTKQVFPARVEHVARHTEFTPRYLFSERERPSLVVRVRLRIEDPEQRLHAGLPAFASFQREP